MKPPLKSATVLALGLLLAGVSIWPASAQAAAYAVEQVRLRTGDGVFLDGVLYRPAANPRRIALLLVHGYGANFYEAYFPRFAQAAAEQGYASLALNLRDHDTGPKVSDFADNEADIAAGAGYLRKLGHPRLVLLGQSMGSNRVLYYQAVSDDPGIAATVLIAPPGNLFEWNAWQFGRKEAQATVDKALAMQAAGQERQPMLVDLGPLGKALYTPRYLLSLRGPNARSDPYPNIRKVTGPILIVQGTADKFVEPGVAASLRRAATSSRRADLISIDGADHSFKQQEAALTQQVLRWLKQVAP